MAKAKKLCKWKKGEHEDKLETLKGIVGKPKFVCKRCGRAAAAKKWICKPTAL